jgi:hypothetical protein
MAGKPRGQRTDRGPIAMSLTTRDTTISARINGVLVGTVTSHAYEDGPAGLASLGFYPVQYLGFRVG